MLDLQIPVMLLLATIMEAAWLMPQMQMHLFAPALMDSLEKVALVNKKLLVQLKVSEIVLFDCVLVTFCVHQLPYARNY